MFAVTARWNVSSQHRTASGLAAFLLAAVTLFPAAAAAQSQQAQTAPCGEREAIIERLAMSFGEEPISMAITAAGDLLEVLASPAGNWSIIITQAQGPTCLMTAGDGWRGAPGSSSWESQISGKLPPQLAKPHFRRQ